MAKDALVHLGEAVRYTGADAFDDVFGVQNGVVESLHQELGKKEVPPGPRLEFVQDPVVH